MDLHPGYEGTEKFRGGLQYYMIGSNDFYSKFSVIKKHEIRGVKSFNGENFFSY